MKLIEIKELSANEIKEQVKKSRLELLNLRMKFASRQLENPSQIKKKKKEIARLLTISTQKANDKTEALKSKSTEIEKKIKKPKRRVKEDTKK